jgi:hypothetical protein
MKLNPTFAAATSSILSGVLSNAAMAHPGHGETGLMHEHSAAVIAGTVVAATVVIGGLLAARMASRGQLPALRALTSLLRRK